MKKKGKRLFGILLSIALVLGMMPGMSLMAYAADTLTIADLVTAVGTSTFNYSDAYKVQVVEGKLMNVNPWNEEEARDLTYNSSDGKYHLKFGQFDNDWYIVIDSNNYITSFMTDNGGKYDSYSGKSQYALNLSAPETAVTSVSLDPGEVQTITVGQTLKITADVDPDNATDKTVKWSVGGTNPGAVTLYSDAACTEGKKVTLDTATSTLTVYAKGISAGSATVTATSNADSNKSASCDVTVSAAAQEASADLRTVIVGFFTQFNPEFVRMLIKGDSFDEYPVRDAVSAKYNGEDGDITYSKTSDNSADITISHGGNKLRFSVSIETDPETGDSNTVVGEVTYTGDEPTAFSLSLDPTAIGSDGPVVTSVYPAPHTHTVGEGASAQTITFQPWTKTDSLPTDTGSYYLTEDVTLNGCWSVSNSVNLCLNGHGIRANATDSKKFSVIQIGNDATLNLFDCGTSEHKYTVDGNGLATVNDNATGSGVKTFTGGYITGGIQTNGAAMFIDKGIVNMYGGTIIGNKEKNNGVVNVNTCTFNMYGGQIIGNTAKTGGGVYVWTDGSFTMHDGVIADNTATGGGGVYIYRSSFIMKDGAISRNAAGAGGGVVIDAEDGPSSFTMEGGTISDNMATLMGGGVFNNCGDLTITGGTISDNKSEQGGGVVSIIGNPKLSGNVIIDGNQGGTFTEGEFSKETDQNLCLADSKINITGALASTAKIGVTVVDMASTDPTGGVFTTGSTDTLKASDYIDNFFSDFSGFAVQVTGKELKLHAHEFTYAASGATITTTCTDTDGCPDGYDETGFALTINKPTLTYVGQTGEGISAEATITGYPETAPVGLAKEPTEIKYQTKAGDTWGDETTTPPEAAGTHRALFTWGEKTTSVEYSILTEEEAAELDNAKTEATQSLSSLDLSYFDDQKKVQELIDKAIADIDAASSIEEIGQILRETTDALKAAANMLLESSIDSVMGPNIPQPLANRLSVIALRAELNIGKALTPEAVVDILKDAELAILQEVATYTMDLVKDSALDEVETYDPKDYSGDDNQTVIDAIAAAKSAIENAESLNAIETAMTTFREAVKNVKTDLEKAKEKAQEDIDNVVKADYVEADQAAVQALKEKMTAKLGKADSVDRVEDIMDIFQKELAGFTTKEAALKDAQAKANEAVAAVQPEDYIEADRETVSNAKSTATSAIGEAKTVDEVATALTAFGNAIKDCKTSIEAEAEAAAALAEAKAGAKAELTGYADGDNYREAQKKELLTAIAVGKQAIDDAPSAEVIKAILENVKKGIDDIKTDAQLTAEELTSSKAFTETLVGAFDPEDFLSDDQVGDTEKSSAQTVTDAKTAALADEGAGSVKAAKTVEEVDAALDAFMNAIKDCKTKAKAEAEAAEALAKAKEDAKATLMGYVNPDNYREAQQDELKIELMVARLAIEDADSIEGVGTALEWAKGEIEAIKTDEQMAAEEVTNAADKSLADASKNAEAAAAAATKAATDPYASEADKTAISGAKKAVDDAVAAAGKLPADATAKQKADAAAAIEAAVKALDTATDTAGINNAAAKAAAGDLANKEAQLEAAKGHALDRLEDFSEVKALPDFSKAEKKAYDQVVAKGKAAINAAASKDAADAALKQAKKDVNAALAKIKKDRAEAKAKKVKTVTVNVATVNAKAVDKAVKKAGGKAKYVKTIVIGKNVKKINAKAFTKYKKAKTLQVKTTKLQKKTVKNSLKGSKVTTIKVKVGNKKANKKYVKNYKKIFTAKNAGKKVKVAA